MGVTVQAIVAGDVSGVGFGISPNDPSQAVIEAVYGLNQGLVDGDVTPDAWILRRDDGAILSHRSPERDKAMRPVVDPAGEGVRLVPLSADQKAWPPLAPEAVAAVFDMIGTAETLFGVPQDVEWTFKGGRLFVLQSRPVTTAGKGEDSTDNRAWYLSQHRSFENLKQLARRVKDVLLPRMADAARTMAGQDLSSLTDSELAEEIRRRRETYGKWKKVYWDEFIPLAHGIRLFGQVYNEAVRPRDPFEFVDLLKGADLLSLQRNRMITEMAGMVRQDARLTESLASGTPVSDGPFLATLDQFMDRFGVTAWGAGVVQDRDRVIRMILSLARLPETGIHDAVAESRRPEDLESAFLEQFTGENRAWAEEMLAVGRESYRLRDDDNIYLGRIEGFMLKAFEEGRLRLQASGAVDDSAGRSNLVQVLEQRDAELARAKAKPKQAGREVALPPAHEREIKARQIVGQPAGPGLARGKARVITGPDDLFDFQSGEILVCDAVDPNMTFLVPLAAAVVERRGGMLIHGAIIAREYGLPCVTGVPDAVRFIETGDEITVDGYLGIVIRHFELT
jgi:pyruvate,water dikinase